MGELKGRGDGRMAIEEGWEGRNRTEVTRAEEAEVWMWEEMLSKTRD